MKKNPWLIIPFLVIAGILAYLLQGFVRFMLVSPLADLWWMLEVLYRSIPQNVYWLILIVLAFLIAIGSISGLFNGDRPKRARTHGDRGPVEDLAISIERGRGSRYFRWLVARRLGLLAADMLTRNDQSREEKNGNKLTGKDWQPVEEIQKFLESGLRRYEPPPRRKIALKHEEVLDVNPHKVVAYLETQMEKRSGRKYS